MAPTEHDAELPQVAADELTPYCSLMILRTTGSNYELVMRTLSNAMARAALRKRAGTRSELVASGLSGAAGYLRPGSSGDGIHAAWAFVYRKLDEPALSINSSYFIDHASHLCVVT